MAGQVYRLVMQVATNARFLPEYTKVKSAISNSTSTKGRQPVTSVSVVNWMHVSVLLRCAENAFKDSLLIMQKQSPMYRKKILGNGRRSHSPKYMFSREPQES